MQRLFSATGKASSDTLATWAAMSTREFYDGDFELDSREPVEFSFEKAICYPVSLTRLSSRSPLGFRRTWQHIRNNKVGFRVIWFVKTGKLHVVRSQGTCDISAGEAGIVDSGAPFHAKVVADADGNYESYQLTVPADMFLTHLQEADKLTAPFSLATPEGRVVMDLVELMARDGECLSRRAAKPLTESLLEAIADCMGYRNNHLPRRQRLVDKRLSDIENYIQMNLSDPDLCYDRVAASCGISPRYLCYVLKANSTSFSELLWKNRLPKARDLLISPATRGYPIHEIAFMSGFKSAAHFSRMFKAAYGCPPREYRMAGGQAAATAVAEVDPELGRIGLDIYEREAA